MRLFILLFFSIPLSLSAQFTPVNSGTALSDATYVETIDVDGKNFEVFKNQKGFHFIVMTSRKGVKYPKWVGQELAPVEYYNGRRVRKTAAGNYLILLLDSRGVVGLQYLDRN